MKESTKKFEEFWAAEEPKLNEIMDERTIKLAKMLSKNAFLEGALWSAKKVLTPKQ